MTANTFIFPVMNLQLFAEGAEEGGTSAPGATADSGLAAARKGANNPLANVVYGKQDAQVASEQEATEPQVKTPDRQAQFEKLIKEDYKDLYDARVQDIVKARLKGTKETVDRYNELVPTLELLAKKYGVNANDIKALGKAIEEDDSYFEEEALEKGISVEELKRVRKIEKENSELRAKMREQAAKENADKIYAQWMEQAEAAKAKYPSLDLETELHNQAFVDLLRNGIDVDTAYTVVHKDEIIPAAMQYAVKTAEQKLTNKVIANGARPTENGISSQSATVVKSDVSQLSKADREEIDRRVQRGEKIRF